MSNSLDHLMDAFAGESQANRKYLAFAKQADKDGFPQVAKLFRAAAEAETIHAHKHLAMAKKIHATPENLQEAIAGETHEAVSMYPMMIKDLEAEGHNTEAAYLKMVQQVEQVHANLYKKAAKDPIALEACDYYICPVCGFTHEGKMTEKCPICGVAGDKFYTIG